MIDEFLFFDKAPGTLSLYEAVRDMIFSEFTDVNVKVSKSQISFSNKYGFAYVSLPMRKIKGCSGAYILFTFGLGRKEEHPRILISAEPYPGRWTHHVVIRSADEVDGQIREWVGEAYRFSNEKKRRR